MHAFQPDGFQLAFQLTFEGSWPAAVAFLGSGDKLAAANQNGEIYVWELPETPPAVDPNDKERPAPNVWPVRQLVGHQNSITRLASVADGSLLFSASMDRTVRVWNSAGPTSGKAQVVLDADTRQRAARRAGKKEPDAATGVEVELQTACDVLAGHEEWVYALGLSGDGRRAVSGDAAGRVIVWDIAERRLQRQWTGHPWNWITAAALSSDGSQALISEYRYKRDDFDVPTPALKLWDVDSQEERLDLLKLQFPKLDPLARSYGASQLWRKFVGNGLIAVAISPDGKLLAAGQGGETDVGKVHLFDAESGALLRTVSEHRYGVADLLFTADSRYVISGGRDTSLRIVDVADGREAAVLGSPRGGQFKDWLAAVAISPDQQTLAAADIGGLVQVWRRGG